MPILKCYIMKSEREGREFELRRKGGRVEGTKKGWMAETKDGWMQDMVNGHARERKGERMGRTTCRHTDALKQHRFSHASYASA